MKDDGRNYSVFPNQVWRHGTHSFKTNPFREIAIALEPTPKTTPGLHLDAVQRLLPARSQMRYRTVLFSALYLSFFS
jgi:hypothetical protein